MKRFILLIFIFTNIFFISFSSEKAEKGILDLREEKDFKIIKLIGEWEIYMNSFLSYDEIKNKEEKTYIKLPSNWNKLNKKNKGKGYATYRLKIFVPNEKQNYSIKLPYIEMAYEVWINGKKEFNNGKIGISPYSTETNYNPKTLEVKQKDGIVDIVIYFSNFHRIKGGILKSIYFGVKEDITLNREMGLSFSFFVIGLCLIMGTYHLIIFFLKRNHKASLYFGLFTLLVVLRQLLTGETISVFNLNNFNGLLFLKMKFLSYYLPVPVFSLFFKEIGLIKKKNNDFLHKIEVKIGLLLTLIAILFPIKIAILTIIPFEIYLILIMIHGSYLFFIEIKNKNINAIISSFGFFILLLTIIDELLYHNQLNSIGNLVPIGMLFLILSHALIVAIDLTKEYLENENLSITLKKHTKELENKNNLLEKMDKIKDEFLANTSHELKTPLNGMIGIADSLLAGVTGKLSKNTNKNLNLIVNSGLRLLNLIEDILDFLKLKSNTLKLNKKKIDLYKNVEIVLSFLKTLVINKDIEIFNLIPKDKIYIMGDENRFQQILFNLIGNSIKFTNNGKIVITGKIYGTNALISINDTGIGIAEKNRNKIFREFFQEERIKDISIKGAGLGLSITKKLIEYHNGDIWFESEEEVGSSFHFTIPLADNTEYSIENIEVNEMLLSKIENYQEILYFNDELKKEYSINNTNKNSSILVVDNNLINLKVLENILSLEGLDIDSVLNGAAAIEKTNKKKYDLIILDISMPYMSGFEICEKVREKYSKFDLPIMFLTAKKDENNYFEAYRIGANDLLYKPFDKNELLFKVKNLLDIRKN